MRRTAVLAAIAVATFAAAGIARRAEPPAVASWSTPSSAVRASPSRTSTATAWTAHRIRPGPDLGDGAHSWSSGWSRALALLLGGCAGVGITDQELEHRLAVMPETVHGAEVQERPVRTMAVDTQDIGERTSCGPIVPLQAQPDVRGTIVRLVGNRLAIRLDRDSAVPPEGTICSLAIHSARGYKGEALVLDRLPGHALATVYLRKPLVDAIAIGDRAASRAP